MDGLFLRPQHLDREASQAGSTRAADGGILNVSNQDESSDEELDTGMEDPTTTAG